MKGAGTFISGEMTFARLPTGGWAAGAGDVLAGLIGGLWAQHPEMAADQIAQAGVYLHTRRAVAIEARTATRLLPDRWTRLDAPFNTRHPRRRGEKWSVG